jgi:UDP:flavonoid glycosyltransferase YjiC (YdhE family)
MLVEAGHHRGAIGLARRLRARGHRVVFLSLPDAAAMVQAEGFEFIPFAADVMPAGSMDKHFAGLTSRRVREKTFTAFLAAIERGPLDVCLQSIKPDVLMCDTLVWYVALRALRLGIPTINVSIVLSSHPNSRVPPVISTLRPGQGWWSRVRVWSAWQWLRLKFFFTKRLAPLVTGAYRFPTRMHHLEGAFRRLARNAGVDLREGSSFWFGEIGPRLILPEIVLCPRALEFAGRTEELRHYVSEVVDLDRKEEPLAPELPSNGSIIYCSLGTSARSYPHAACFFEAVVDATRVRRDWQFVVHAGGHPFAHRIGPEQNLVVRDSVPQLAVLRRAACLVTHGGLNSILEGVHFEVPMVIVPGARDQPGNAVRAVAHGVAKTTRMASLTGAGLVSLVERVLADEDLRSNLARMKREMANEHGLEPAIAMIERAGRAAQTESPVPN